MVVQTRPRELHLNQQNNIMCEFKRYNFGIILIMPQIIKCASTAIHHVSWVDILTVKPVGPTRVERVAYTVQCDCCHHISG